MACKFMKPTCGIFLRNRCCCWYWCCVSEFWVLHMCMTQAARALVHYTHSAIEDLKQDEDEMLRGTAPVALLP